MKKILKIAALTCVALLSACTSLEKRVEQGEVVNSERDLHRHGRFAVLVYDKTQDKNTESIQGNFDWLSQGSQVVLDLSSPLGQVLARVTVQDGFSRLDRVNGESLMATHPDELVRAVIGRDFPVGGLQYWIRGRALPNIPLENAEYDDQNRLVKFVQAGWRVTAQDYDNYGPKRFHLLNNQTTERITIRIVMD